MLAWSCSNLSKSLHMHCHIANKLRGRPARLPLYKYDYMYCMVVVTALHWLLPFSPQLVTGMPAMSMDINDVDTMTYCLVQSVVSTSFTFPAILGMPTALEFCKLC